MLQGQPWSAPACTRVLVRSPSGEYVTPKDAINSVNSSFSETGEGLYSQMPISSKQLSYAPAFHESLPPFP